MEQEPHVSGQYVKGFRGNSSVLFDEINGPNQRILTDLCVQGVDLR